MILHDLHKKGVTKEQHYVPRMYLKRFAFDGNMCYTLNSNNEIHQQNIKNICKEKNLYELTTRDGTIVQTNLFENMFGRLETSFTPFFDEFLKIIQDHHSGVDYLLQEENRKCLMCFIASLLLRNKETIKVTKEIGAETGFIWTDRQARNNGILHNSTMMMNLTEKLDKDFNILIHINKTDVPFVTSNIPFRVIPIKEDDAFGGIWYWPLSPKCLIVLEPIWPLKLKQDKELQSRPEFVERVNIHFATLINTLIISNDKNTLEDLKRRRAA